MNTHNMRLHPEPFKKIKSGTKNVELRLNDEKRQKINIGDSITFTNRVGGEVLKKEVADLHNANDFMDLLDKFSLEELGLDDKDEIKLMREYYSSQDTEKYGVVGIQLK